MLQLAAASEKSGKALAKELMMPQGIDLSSLGDLAAVLGVSQGLNLLVNNQQGPNPPPLFPRPLTLLVYLLQKLIVLDTRSSFPA